MSKKVVLWNYWRSSASWRVRIALNLKGIDYVYKAVDIVKGDQFTHEFDRKNAKNEIPVLEIDGQDLTQSVAIIEYLNETNPQGPNLLPSDPVKRAKARALVEIFNSGTQPYHNLNVILRLTDELGEYKKNEWLQFYLSKGFRAFEEMLKQTSGKYCVGDEITIADVYLVPQVYAGYRFNVDMSRYPIIGRINAELENLDAFKRAHAYRQPDTPPEFNFYMYN